MSFRSGWHYGILSLTLESRLVDGNVVPGPITRMLVQDHTLLSWSIAFKGIFHSFTHTQAVPNLYEFLYIL